MVTEAQANVTFKSKNEIAAVRFPPLVVNLDHLSHLPLPLDAQRPLGITGAGVSLDADGALLGGHALTTSTLSPGFSGPGARTTATTPRLP